MSVGRRTVSILSILGLLAAVSGACGSSSSGPPEDGEPTGVLEVATSTSGQSPDPDGYTVAVDEGSGQSISVNGSVTFTDLSAGDHTVTLSGVASNCEVSGSNPRTVSVPESGSTSTTFTISCESTGGGNGSTSSVQITGISFDASSHNRFDNNTDIFPTTWHDDGRIYTMGGDGDGWDGVDTRGLDVNRLDEVGPDGDLSQGTEVDSKVDVLPKGIISIDGTMYRFEEERADADGDGGSFEDLMIGRSTDDGATWEYLTGGDPSNEADYAYVSVTTQLSFIQGGQAYGTWWDESHGGEGDYVYFAGNDGSNLNEIVLARAPRSADLRDPANHEWFTGTDGGNNASWSSNEADRQPVYTGTDVHWGATINWNPVLNRFLLSHFDDSNNGVLTILEGPTPWGPWTEIYNGELPGSLGDGIEKYGIHFVNKRGVSGVTDWLSSDGTTWWGVFSGMDEWDSFNTVRATLTTAQ